MQRQPGQELAFIETVQQLEFSVQELSAQQQALDRWLSELESLLLARLIPTTGLTQRHTLTHQAQQLHQTVRQSIQLWQQAKHDLKPMLDLATFFADKVMLLVFGKFNAGKSSFCNLVAERFSIYQQSVQHFTLEQGEICFHNRIFQEGATETTAHIQGVILADRLVLLDTPGLHSVTMENAALTQSFIESADGVLWLSSSTSPGQLQELTELAQELQRGKPLLPIITRSDYMDEAVVDNEIKKVLCNKTADNRKVQETDVRARAQEHLFQKQLEPSLIQRPISVSVYSAREHGLSALALEQAGFYRLYEALLELIEPVLAYKGRKPIEVYVHYLQEQVLTRVEGLEQKIAGLHHEIEQQQVKLTQVLPAMTDQLWRHAMSVVPTLLDRYLDQEQGAALIAQATQQIIADQLATYLEADVASYLIDMERFCAADFLVEHLSQQRFAVGDYEKVYVALEQAILRQLEQYEVALAAQAQEHLQNLATHLMAFSEQMGSKKQEFTAWLEQRQLTIKDLA